MNHFRTHSLVYYVITYPVTMFAVWMGLVFGLQTAARIAGAL